MASFGLYNSKGGIGKTAAAVNLAFLASRDGMKTLLWDLDPQALPHRSIRGTLGLLIQSLFCTSGMLIFHCLFRRHEVRSFFIQFS